jgi:hypothetical protein
MIFTNSVIMPQHASSLLINSQRLNNSTINTILKVYRENIPPLWSSGQSSWLQIRRPGLDSRHYKKKKVMGLEWGPLSLMSTTEELLDRKVAAPV